MHLHRRAAPGKPLERSSPNPSLKNGMDSARRGVGGVKRGLRWFWHVLWEEDSLLSWVLNVVVAFVLMKFVIYPGLGFVLGTTHPVVAVVSGSMEHDNPFGQWYEIQKDFYSSYNISQQRFSGFPMPGGINTGDIIVLRGRPPEQINVGDVIVFTQAGPEPIIHRAVRKWESNHHYYFETKGDHNRGVSIVDQNIVDQRVLGKAAFRIPYLGYVKIWFTRYIVCTVNPAATSCI